MNLETGTILANRYEILRLLGQGGMGSVYEARHTGTRKRMALKVITADVTMHPGLVARFQVEARASGAIESQHIAQVFDVGSDETLKVPYMAMEYLVGEDLEQLLMRVGPLPPDLALRIIAQACSGLEKAHEADVVHRDLKPANIFVTRREGEEIVVKLLDFGIAKILQEDEKDAPGLTRTGSLIGSPLYMSPEQARGRRGGIDQRTDIWSIGVVLYQLLAGRVPNQEQEAMGDLIIAICSEPAPSVQEVAPWVAPEVADIIARALQIDIEQRYQTIGDMRRDILALLPDGTRITPSMLGSLDEATRSQVAPAASSRSGSTGDRPIKLTTGPGPAAATDVGGHVAASTGVQPVPSVTTGALASDAEPAKPTRSPLLFVGVAAAIALGAVVAVGLSGGASTAGDAPAAMGAATTAPSVAATAPATTPDAPAGPAAHSAPSAMSATPAPSAEAPIVTPSGPPPASPSASAVVAPRPRAPAPAAPAASVPAAPAVSTAPPAPPRKNPLDVTIK